ncbi:ATP-binding protein [Mycobacterium parmense]|uniref:Anti-sigma regulatory factor n=1 Tax=Mycobacterium parmense TaxID=185642 RepID=A0A7I7YPH1_9MYCO|nr:ATP-binding protein [Mycobacterium parmense]MCV7349669.1 ATP-binding protein [Mycobacterium parmense]ORW51871.1 hypothetical protein AWC20_22305 [Mycobacterium parmense]BBZ43680.1 anti-sigma regulatory factor [Mycobacterium parmense]
MRRTDDANFVVPSANFTGRADAENVAVFRARFQKWLETHFSLSPERVSDVILSTGEALSNCAEHAYRDSGRPGVMTLSVRYETPGATIVVCVTDGGRWVEPAANAPTGFRGRGLPLMHALSDECTVEGRADGTTVCLQFHRCATKSGGR